MREGDDEAAMSAFGMAHALTRDAGLRMLSAAYAGHLSLIHTYVGDLDGALQWNSRALEQAERAGHDAHIANALSNLSETQRLLGDARDAAASAERATVLAERAGDRVSLAHASLNLGAALALAGETDRALEWLTRAERAMGDLGIDTMAATLHAHVGLVLQASGDAHAAARRYRLAIEAPRDNPIDQAGAMHRLGRMLADDDPSAAIDLFDEAFSLVGGRFERVSSAIRADRDALAGGHALADGVPHSQPFGDGAG
jgi:tetratricopeptide (TPR) repeat protein